MPDRWAELIRQTLAGERQAAHTLVLELHSVVQARVARVLRQARPAADRSIQQEVADLTQEVFGRLFGDRGKVLQSWDPERGLSLPNFVGLVTERHVIGALRSDRRNPWTEDPTMVATLDHHPAETSDPEPMVRSRELLETLLDRLRLALSPLGFHMFRLLYVEECSVEEAAESVHMSADAVYAWRSRLRKLVASLAADLVTPAPRRKELP
jgi:RNA polymerase sigma factor (sigma-70 family)